MAARRVIANAGPAQAAGVATKQIRGHARFVDEDVGTGVVQRLRLLPALAIGGDVRASLLVRVYRFF